MKCEDDALHSPSIGVIEKTCFISFELDELLGPNAGLMARWFITETKKLNPSKQNLQQRDITTFKRIKI